MSISIGSLGSNKPNFLIFIVDEARFPPVYETADIRSWRKQYLVAEELIRLHGLEFTRHYAGATACCPSRATLLTGQYPSLHGVSQTTGAAKTSFDSDMFWLDRNTVPTLGSYFQQAGYQTFYKGKWHISDGDIIVPGTHASTLSYHPITGVPDPQKEELYRNANRLQDYGFTGWIGPEPHGKSPHKSGSSAGVGVSGRDISFADESIQLLQFLEQQKQSDENQKPWLMVTSFVNPHDIVLYGAFTARNPLFQFHVDDSTPLIAPPPTIHESLATKPRCQRSYRRIFPLAFQPIFQNMHYRRLYYQLHKNVDQQIRRVFEALRQTSFYEQTIVLFTSDHGELLGAHGNLHQKFYCAYEEAIHIPLIIHNPLLFPQPAQTELLTSHVDILPTLLGLAGIDSREVQMKLHQTHSEVRPLVGRDLSPLVLGRGYPDRAGEPLYFMTQDDVTQGQHQVSVLGVPYPSVVQPNQIETVITPLETEGKREIWKYSRYYDKRQALRGHKACEPAEEFEMYNLTADPLEKINLAYPLFATSESMRIQQFLACLLTEQRQQKQLRPVRG